MMPKAVEGAKRVHAFLSGRVQGVGFRAFTEREARMLKLTGWVKNLRDGRVEAVVEGPPDKVAALLEKLKTGPRAAKVEKLDVKDEPAEGGFEGFETRF
ncbi:MAG TPA: acylphosphatase [Planctomycetota bacterium]|nr:acylphosphatase [Planctomycetota bacterium]